MNKSASTMYYGDCEQVVAERVEPWSVDLAFLDVPYHRALEEDWDRDSRDVDDYCALTTRQLLPSIDALRPGGSAYLFGKSQVLPHLLAHLMREASARGLHLLHKQTIVLRKGLASVGGKRTNHYKVFPTETEQVALLVRDPRAVVRALLLRAKEVSGLSVKQINSLMAQVLGTAVTTPDGGGAPAVVGGGMWSIYTGENLLGAVPTPERWAALQKILPLPSYVQPYKLAQTFNLPFGVTDVWDFKPPMPSERRHPAQKPRDIIQRILDTSSNPGDTVLDPYAGSAEVGVVAFCTGRHYVGVERDTLHFANSSAYLRQLTDPDEDT